MKGLLCASLFICSLLTNAGCYRTPDWSDKDVDFLISKLKSRDAFNRGLAVSYLEDTTEERHKVVAALTHTLLNDKKEDVRGQAARALGRMKPPAAEAVPALIAALNLPPKDRGKPISRYSSMPHLLPPAAKDALESIGTPEALEAVNEFRKSGPKLIESSIPDGTTGVDPEFINEHGITLRFGSNRLGGCSLYDAAGRRVWTKSFTTDSVTVKPGSDDRKLINGTVYTVSGRVEDDYYRKLDFEITFTTKP